MATVTSRTKSTDGEQRVLLHGVSWELYEQLLALDNRGIRLTYDRGDLELMSPSNTHEWLAHLLDRLISDLTIELGMSIRGCRSTTWRKQEMGKGLESDDCYYIQSEPRVRGKELDINTDPPPDLAIEIDITSSSIDRLGIYAALGVPELWRFDSSTLRVYQLRETGDYEETDGSLAFPFLPVQELVRFLEMRTESDENSLVREFREWVRRSFGQG